MAFDKANRTNLPSREKDLLESNLRRGCTTIKLEDHTQGMQLFKRASKYLNYKKQL